MKQVSSSRYATLATLRNLKNILPLNIRKTLVEVLVLSKLCLSGVIYSNLPDYLINRLQRMVSKLRLAIKEQFQWLLLKASHKQYIVLHGQAISK